MTKVLVNQKNCEEILDVFTTQNYDLRQKYFRLRLTGLEATNAEIFSNLRFLRKFDFFSLKCATKYFFFSNSNSSVQTNSLFVSPCLGFIAVISEYFVMNTEH